MQVLFNQVDIICSMVGSNSLITDFFTKAIGHKKAGFYHSELILTKRDIFRQPNWTKYSRSLKNSQLNVLDCILKSDAFRSHAHARLEIERASPEHMASFRPCKI